MTAGSNYITNTPPVNSQTEMDLLALMPATPRNYGLAVQHVAPRVSLGKDADGRHGASFRAPASKAWKYPELGYAESARMVGAIVVDVDDVDAFLGARMRFDGTGIGAPEPNWITRRRASGRFHATFTLRSPIYVGPGAAAKPIAVLRRATAWFAFGCGGDGSYRNQLAHNPMRTPHAPGRDWTTEWLRREPYPLLELGNAVPKGWRAPAARRAKAAKTLAEAVPGNRHTTLCRELGRWLGAPANWRASDADVLAAASAMNDMIPVPLPLQEVAHMAHGLLRSQRRKLATGEQQDGFRAIQSSRGRTSGRKRHEQARPRQLELMADVRAGESIHAASANHGVHRVHGGRLAGKEQAAYRLERDAEIRALLSTGRTVRSTALAMGCSKSLVGKVKVKMRLSTNAT